MYEDIRALTDFLPTLKWGLIPSKVLALMEKHQKYDVSYNEGNIGTACLCVRNTLVYNFIGDCGTLYLSGANNAQTSDLAFIEEYASQSGFSNIFATICKPDTAESVKIFKDRGWEEIHRSDSNRNPGKEHHVMFLHIDCVHKGY